MSVQTVPRVLRTETVPLDTLKQFPRNANNGDLEAIAASLKTHGQYRALVVNEPTRTILCGNQTYHALLALGEKDALVHWINVTEDQAERIALIDNRMRDLSRWDKGMLVLELEELSNGPLGLDGTGFDYRALDDLRAQLEIPIKLDPQPFQGQYGESEEEYEARLRRAAPGQGLRELVLLYEPEDHAKVVEMLTTLKKRWGLKGGHAPIVMTALEFAVAGEK